MLNIAIELVNNTYAACAWDTAHIEGFVEWPPSAWRILRGIISGAFQVRRQNLNFNWDLFELTVLELAKSPLSYYLPPSSYVQINTYRKDRNDKPSLYRAGKMLTSGELRFNSQDRTIYLFWEVKLNLEQIELLKACIVNCRYLGRSESLAEWKIVSEVERSPNCYPAPQGLIRVLTPTENLQFSDLLKSPHQIYVREARQHIPGATFISYKREEPVSELFLDKSSQVSNYARIDLVAKFPLKKQNMLYFANKIHKTLVHTKGGALPLPSFAGIDFSLDTRKDNYARNNNHVYFVPVIHDNLVVAFELYCEAGFSQAEKNKLARLRKLYTKLGEITLIMSILGNKLDRHRASYVWKSLTPFFLPRIPATRRGKPRAIAGSIFQKDGVEHQGLRLLLHLPQFEHWKNGTKIEYIPSEQGLQQWIDGSLFCTARSVPFDRWWLWYLDRPHGKRAVREGYCLELEFIQPQVSPIAIGYSAHFGLGVLSPRRGRVAVENESLDRILVS